MATRLSVSDVLDRLDDDDWGFSDDESDCGGEEVSGYLPGVPESAGVEAGEEFEVSDHNDPSVPGQEGGEGQESSKLTSIV